jgi:hypothetical protein
LGARIDLLGCEYLGGCPSVGTRVLNKVELHFDPAGLAVAIAPQGLFTLAGAHPVLALPWEEITALSATTVQHAAESLPIRLARSALKVVTMRLNLPDQLTVGSGDWTMTVGVRMAADELTASLRDLLAGIDGPVPAITAS